MAEQKNIVIFDGKEVEVKNKIGDLLVIWTEDGIRVISEGDVQKKETKKPRKNAVD